jgi:hypothetical protein
MRLSCAIVREAITAGLPLGYPCDPSARLDHPVSCTDFLVIVWRRMIKRPALGFLLVIFLAGFRPAGISAGQTQQPQPGKLPVAKAVRVDHGPRMDGSLDDPLWELAIPVSDFRQKEPYEGQPATGKPKFAFYIHDTPCTSGFDAMTLNRQKLLQPNFGVT